ncbi:MAG: hypothetical protein M5U12_01465 [Verrucomicrobia bacterium]|nr:hypothetical protein [Verrucomicrobiota bacterium]
MPWATPEPRDHRGVLALHYTNRSGRNDIVTCRVARDRDHVFFQVQTREPLSPPTDPGWMWLLIDVDQNVATGWEGYDFILNRTRDDAGTTWLEQHTAGWDWKPRVRVPFRASGTHLCLAVPRTALGLEGGQTSVALDFKWADNQPEPPSLLEAYTTGEVAPDGRFKYRYRAE